MKRSAMNESSRSLNDVTNSQFYFWRQKFNHQRHNKVTKIVDSFAEGLYIFLTLDSSLFEELWGSWVELQREELSAKEQQETSALHPHLSVKQ
jgi:hypothetical protein